MISKKIGWGILAVLLLVAPVKAGGPDELFLHDGKSISGRVTSETPTEYTIRTAPNMYLRISKSKVLRAEIAPKDNRPRYRMETPKPSTSTAPASSVKSSSAPVKTATAAASAPPAPTPLMNTGASLRTTERTKGKVRMVDTLSIVVGTVSAPTAAQALETIYKGRYDTRRIAGRNHQAGKFSWQASWTGKADVSGAARWQELVVRDTVTLSMTRWVPPVVPPEADRLQWNAWEAAFRDHMNGHADVYMRVTASFAEAAGNLSASSEDALRTRTERLFQSMLDQAERQNEGYDRRAGAPPVIPVKKP